MKYVALLVALVLADPALAQEKPKSIVVPFDLIRSRHMIVDVIVNGKGPFTLIFDTGAPATLIGPTLFSARARARASSEPSPRSVYTPMSPSSAHET